MTQGSLLEWSPPAPSPKATEQSRQLSRVESNQGAFILSWASMRWESGEPTFHLGALEHDVQANVGGTPGSAGRILRLLRASGHLDYTVERSASRYTLTMVRS